MTVKMQEKMEECACSPSQDEKVSEFNAFRRHVVDTLQEESQRLQKLYTWCQMHYNAFTQGAEPFEEISGLKEQMDRLAREMVSRRP